MIGTDPEFFVVNEKGEPVPAWRFYPPKEQKRVTVGDKSSYFRDGYVLEINTTPESCRGRFGNNIQAVLEIATRDLPIGYKLVTNAAMKINLLDMMQDVPPDAQVFGCDPSYNAYEEAELTMDLDPMSHDYRYAGGHLHFSGSEGIGFLKDNPSKFLFAKLCDLFIGLPLAYLYNEDDEVLRRQYYGRAGEMRIQTYRKKGPYSQAIVGVEYRVPSPRIYNDYSIASMLLGVMRNIAIAFDQIAPYWNKSWEKPLQNAINNCEVTEKMLQTVSGSYTPELLTYIKNGKHFKKFSYIAHKGRDWHTAFTEWVVTMFPGANENSTDAYSLAYTKLGWKKTNGYWSPTGKYPLSDGFK